MRHRLNLFNATFKVRLSDRAVDRPVVSFSEAVRRTVKQCQGRQYLDRTKRSDFTGGEELGGDEDDIRPFVCLYTTPHLVGNCLSCVVVSLHRFDKVGSNQTG